MDPWCENSSSEGSGTSSQENIFEDSFNNTVTGVKPTDNNVGKFEKLLDSEEYLKLLDTKLKNLKKSAARPDKEQILSNLIRSESKHIVGILSSTDLELDQEVHSSGVLRQLVPQQPLTVGETVHLVNADQLARSFEENLEDKPMSD